MKQVIRCKSREFMARKYKHTYEYISCVYTDAGMEAYIVSKTGPHRHKYYIEWIDIKRDKYKECRHSSVAFVPTWMEMQREFYKLVHTVLYKCTCLHRHNCKCK